MTDVVDGDTLGVELAGGRVERVRILGINAPEAGECYSDEAREELVRLVEEDAVRLVAGDTDRDRFGRLLRYVERDEADIGLALVSGGFALALAGDARETVLRVAEGEARSARRGLWGFSACGVPPARAAEVTISQVRFDADGDDARNLNDEWIELRNTGSSAVDLSGWGVRDESASHRFVLPDGFVLGSGARVRIHSGCGAAKALALYWCTSGSAIWNNDGDTAFLTDPSGNIVDSRRG